MYIYIYIYIQIGWLDIEHEATVWFHSLFMT